MRSDETSAGVSSISDLLETFLVDVGPERAGRALMSLYRWYEHRPTDAELRDYLTLLVDLGECVASFDSLLDEALHAKVIYRRGEKLLATTGYPGNGYMAEK